MVFRSMSTTSTSSPGAKLRVRNTRAQPIALARPVIISCALLCSLQSIQGHADSLASESVHAGSSNQFIPGSLIYYNPLKHGAKKISRGTNPQAFDNTQLEAAAAYIRANEMSASHRALNHQWLSQESGGDLRLGNKVLSSIVRMGFKTYWTGIRNKHYQSSAVPDGDGNGQLSEEVEYKLRLSQDKVRLVLEYDF